MSSCITLGNRGIQAQIQGGQITMQQYKPSFTNPSILTSTDKTVTLKQNEIESLRQHLVEINTAIKDFAERQVSPNIFHPLGDGGIHVFVTVFKGHLLVHLRQYTRSYVAPTTVYPSKKGICLKMDEWNELHELLKAM
ncbi:MAG: transcriptional coactivator p15/PC4 family protein [Cyanophyceae cyanobacterium]